MFAILSSQIFTARTRPPELLPKKRVEFGVVDIGVEHAFLEVVQDDEAGRAAQTFEGEAVEFAPGAAAGLEREQPDAFAAAAERVLSARLRRFGLGAYSCEEYTHIKARKHGWRAACKSNGGMDATYIWEEYRARKRRTDVRPIPNRRAISDLLTPWRNNFLAATAWWTTVGGRPSRLPCCRA